MELYLIRHGRTEPNELRQYCGSSDVPLSEGGRAELEQLSRARPLPSFDLVAVTGMRRTLETAAILLPGAETVSVPTFREMDFGIFECHDYETLRHWPEFTAWINDRSGDLPCPGGESRNAYSARIREAFPAFVASLPRDAERICLICHGGTVSALMETFCTDTAETFARQPDNGRGWRVRVGTDPLRLEDAARI